jgi:DNA-binding NarL/FixJ family response regulator
MKERSDARGGISRIMIVDDFAPWRAAAASILKRQPEFQVIAEAVDGLEAIERAIKLSPDIILMDISMPGINGIEAGRRILETSPECRILFISELYSLDIVRETLRAGGSGYVVKSRAATELIPALTTILSGDLFLSSRIVDVDLVRQGEQEFNEPDPDERNPFVAFRRKAQIPELLASTILATRADFGTFQLFDSVDCALKIVAQFGFRSEFINHFEIVDRTCDCPCARAMKTGVRVIVTDVLSDPLVSDKTRNALLGAKVHALQATPLIGSREGLVGVVTTHYSNPGNPLPEVLPQVDNFAARFLASINL